MYTNNWHYLTGREKETEDRLTELVMNVPIRNFSFDWNNKEQPVRIVYEHVARVKLKYSL